MTFEGTGAVSKNDSSLKTSHHKRVKLFQIPDTQIQLRTECFKDLYITLEKEAR